LEPPFCDTCAQTNVNGQCQWCLEHPAMIDGIRAPYLFEGPMREAVHRLKYRGGRAAAPMLGGLLAGYLEHHKSPAQPTGQVLVPVPLHPRRLRSRGYNQSHLLAKEAGKLLDMPVRKDLIRRAKDSPPQVEARSREQRRANVAGSFEAAAGVEGLSILLVDDVATTGSTLFACGGALKEAGAASVWGLVLARDS
jgi:ComF family protein